jgi:thiaminase/transcriptional activator TenA
MTDPLALDHGLFGRLRRDAAAEWNAYVRHDFVRALGAGTLPKPAFQHYLRQDYLFLIQFARAYALAGYKSATVAELSAAASSIRAIVDVEMPLHVAYCAEWGVSEPAMQAEPEALETIAYTRFVLERGLAGDRLDLEAALIPCIVGYAEVAEILLADPATIRHGNPYAAWIDAYAGHDYRAVASAAIVAMETMAQARGAQARYPSLLATFRTACRLEAAFWQMGWRAASC